MRLYRAERVPFGRLVRTPRSVTPPRLRRATKRRMNQVDHLDCALRWLRSVKGRSRRDRIDTERSYSG
jgi:hypothetical protein